MHPGGYFHIRRSGGLDLPSSLEAKFGARFSQVHQIKGKIWEVLLLQNAKNWERITVLGAFGVVSEIQRAKFGVFVTYIFGGKIWAKPPPPPPPNMHMEVPPGPVHYIASNS